MAEPRLGQPNPVHEKTLPRRVGRNNVIGNKSIPKSYEYTICDWLALHRLSAERVEDVLKEISHHRPNVSTQPRQPAHEPSGLRASDAWKLSARALAWKFPHAAEVILDVSRTAELLVASPETGVSKPFTLARDKGTAPLVSICFAGNCLDVLAMAHEFGHAVQYSINADVFVNPVQREIAAFVSERVLLEYVGMLGHPSASGIRSAHISDDAIYLGGDAQSLSLALTNPAAPYRYRWNYPLARYCAARIFAICQNDRLWNAIQGRVLLSDLLETLPGTKN
ncbi:hypothetical protein [Tateyamaria sp. ANG-S1]|uniref:hypothetical protein n=1 Tax=Tateyamaria sp. ANG-S1 TaxID=1577905 RepID=UPI00126A0BB7|nr:hypothetical protein [Tateyamaria sp. ANG-S1]